MDLCKRFLVEAKWFYQGHTPTIKEYLQNGAVSIATPLMLMYTYFLTSETISKEALECIESFPSLIHNAGLLVRLIDDLGTSSVG